MPKSATQLDDFRSWQRPLSPEQFLSVASSILVGNRDALIAYVGRYHELQHPDLFVDDVIHSCFEWLRAQCYGDEISMPFTPEHAISVLCWVRVRIGRPFANARSGMITNAIRKQRAEKVMFTPLNEVVHVNIPCLVEDDSDFDYNRARSLAERVLAEIAEERPKNAFVFRVHTGFHPYAALNNKTLSEMAREMRLSRAECRHIRYVANNSKMADHLGRKALSQEVTGSLVSIHSRQVRAIVSRIKESMRHSAEGGEIDTSRPISDGPSWITKYNCRDFVPSTTVANDGKRTSNAALSGRFRTRNDVVN
jgi:hypothetical protein